MAKIKLRDLKEGMVLADPVRDHNGNMILSAGQKITGKHLKIFGAWGIVEVDVEGNAQVGAQNGSPEDGLQKTSPGVEKAVKDLFRHADTEHPAMAELLELCILRKMNFSQENP